jgi:hypothetical protein
MKHLELFESYFSTEDKNMLNLILRKYRTDFDYDTFMPTSEELRLSLELIGDGTIEETDTYGDRYMYKEDLKDTNCFFVVHGTISTPILTKGYSYEISFWENKPSISQIGGGYGASGILTKKHPNFFKEELGGQNGIFSDHTLISKVCHELIPYLKEKYCK